MGYDRAGDSYPKNDGIDIINYAFELKLTDNSDHIEGNATIDARYVWAGQSTLRLDLTSKSDELEGKGMTVESVMEGDHSLAFTHADNVLMINLGRDIPKMELVSVAVSYSGRPAAGL